MISKISIYIYYMDFTPGRNEPSLSAIGPFKAE